MKFEDVEMHFLELRKISGISQKNQKPYDFSIVRLMDSDYNILEMIAGTELFDFAGAPVPALNASNKGKEVVCAFEMRPGANGRGVSLILYGIELEK